MNRRRLNLRLLAALLVTLALAWALRPDRGRPNYEVLPDMARPVAASTFAPNEVLSGGMTLQPPPPGTIARGSMPFHFGPTRLDALLAGQQLTNPFRRDDPAAVERGAVIYARFCGTCHGPDGEGDGPVVARGYPAPPSFHTPLSRRMRDGQMYHIVTHGRDNMAAFGSRIARDDRWKAVLHVRLMQERVEARAAGQADGGSVGPGGGSRP